MVEAKNISQQADEIEAIVSIYGDSWTFIAATSSYSMDVTPDIRLYISLHPEYPSHKPPNYELFAPGLSGSQKIMIAKEFKRLYNKNYGSPVLYQWIEKLKEIAMEKNTTGRNKNSSKNKNGHHSPSENSSIIPKYEVIHGPSIVDRKSVFQGHCCQVWSLEDINRVMDELLSNSKIRQAKHNIRAYRIETPKGTILQGCDDDGEKQSSNRVLHLLQMLDIKNVVVVVTRWFGGIQIGSDRFRHYNNAAKAVLTQAELIQIKQAPVHSRKGSAKKA